MSADYSVDEQIAVCIARQVVDGENKVIGVAAKQLADSGAGCKMG